MGKDSGGSQSNPANESAIKMAEELFGQTQPLRDQVISEVSGPFEGFTGLDFASNPSTNALQEIINQQFGVARDQAIASTPAGGGLTSALAGLEGQRAGALSSGLAGLFGQDKAFNQQMQAINQQQKFSAAFGTPGTSLTSLNSAGNAQAMLAGQQQQANAGKQGSLGQAAGFALGSSFAPAAAGPAATAASTALVAGSDRRLKRWITRIGTWRGYPLYWWVYVWGVAGIGVMSDEINQDAVIRVNGYDMVDYSRVR